MSRIWATALFLLLAAAAPAAAGVPHVVQPGETLWSIAAANNFTTRALAAANGLSADSPVVAGTSITIPTVAEASAALSRAGIVPGSSTPDESYTVRPGDTLTGIAAALGVSPSALAAANGMSANGYVFAGTTLRVPTGSGSSGASSASTAAAPEPLGAHTVRIGETLSGIAATAGVSLAQLAYMNGLDPDKPLLAGTLIKLPTGASAPSTAPAPAQVVVPPAAPYPTPEHVTSSQIADVAGRYGVPASLASAIAWQESGFSNAVVSPANARGVMQIVPGTWDWVNRNLANDGLNPNSALENVRGGVLYLGQLLRDFGGDQNSAIAAYYQGEGAIRSRGLLPETQRYVANVNALRARFGG